jgi:hypothetical protein
MALAVYSTLWLALVSMGLSLFCFANVLSIMRLRQYFAPRPPRTSLQTALSSSLRIALVLFPCVWLFALWVGIRTGTRALMAGDPIPVSAFILTVLFSFICTWIMSKLTFQSRKKAAADLRDTIRLLRERKAASDNWSDAWRAREVAALQPQLAADPEHVTVWLREWHSKANQRFRGKAWRACLLLGEPDPREIVELFQRDNREDIQRWSLITGKKVPHWG